MNILFAGQISAFGGFSNARSRLDTFIHSGHGVVAVDTTLPRRALRPRLSWHLMGYPVDVRGVNKQIMQHVHQTSFDILWVDKGISIAPQTLRYLKAVQPHMLLVHYNPDDPFGAYRSGWQRFLQCLPLYDVHFVPRRVNIREYYAAGAREVRRFYRGYNPVVCKPLQLTCEEQAEFGVDIGFIGTFETHRSQMLLMLAESGLTVSIRGGGWERWKNRHPNLRVQDPIFGPAYAQTICATRINLHFLRKGNRDEHNTRSVEIPACGSFMLAERTEDHCHLFVEGHEAEFFATEQELLTKVRYYLEHPQARSRIAVAGRERSLRSGYSNTERLQEMLDGLSQFSMSCEATESRLIKVEK